IGIGDMIFCWKQSYLGTSWKCHCFIHKEDWSGTSIEGVSSHISLVKIGMGTYGLNSLDINAFDDEDHQHARLSPSDDIWLMCFDGACSQSGNGAGVVIKSPVGRQFNYTFQLSFEATNNTTEFEALCLGLQQALSLNIK
ncbi:hypothetical protein KI387_023815, partial [Taxus chinensis]